MIHVVHSCHPRYPLTTSLARAVMISFLSFPHSLISLVCFLILPSHVVADPATVPFQNCFDPGSNSSHWRFNVSTIYAQVLQDEVWGHYLNLTVLGESPEDILGLTNTSSSLGEWFSCKTHFVSPIFFSSDFVHNYISPHAKRMVKQFVPMPKSTTTVTTACYGLERKHFLSHTSGSFCHVFNHPMGGESRVNNIEYSSASGGSFWSRARVS